MGLFEVLESEVRWYSRAFPAVFEKAAGWHLRDEGGREYLDFFSGAGTVNYGHNHPLFKERLIEYISEDKIIHSLDMATAAKREFLRRFQDIILEPRSFCYKIQFPGPTGTNAVEAALKLARKVTGRTNILFFHNAYHGVTLGALAVTGNASKRKGAGVPLLHATPVPFDGGLGGQDTIEYIEELLENGSSGLDFPAAVILETVQAEGGVNVASFSWLKRLSELLGRHRVLLIVDDIQVGCGRTGPFFSFEPAGIQPDIICLSKSISGFGLPMSLVLLKPELDVWAPGEHNGTFRGNNLAFVTGAEALLYWEDDSFTREILRKADLVRSGLQVIANRYPEVHPEVRGRGLIQGLRFGLQEFGSQVSAAAFRRGLLIEAVGPKHDVLKVLPPLVIDDASLRKGLEIIENAISEVVSGLPTREPLVARA